MIEPDKHFNGMQITFNTTEDCNLACVYCYEINKKKKTLKLEDAKKFIDLLLQEDDPIGIRGHSEEWIIDSGLILDFIGGDALMDVGLVEKIVEYFMEQAWKLKHRYRYRWRISISTNGTLFSMPGVKDFMDKYARNLSVGVSLDGCPAIHDKNRVFVDGSPSMPVIMKDWEWYKEWCNRASIMLGTKSTLNKDSIPYLYESVKFLHEDMGIPQINMNFIMEDMGLEPSDLVELDKQLSLVKDYVLEHRHSVYLSMFDKSMCLGTPMDEEGKLKGRCGAGSMPSLGIDGKIYPCFRYLPHTAEEGRSDFSVGDVQNGFDKKERFQKVREATRFATSDEECRACPIESMCAYCIGGCYAEFGEFRRTKYICEAAKLQDKYAKLYWREYDKLEGTHTEKAYSKTYQESKQDE